MAKKKKTDPILSLAAHFDRSQFDALVAEKEPKIREKTAIEGPSRRYLRLSRHYGSETAFTVLAAEKVMEKIIKRREELAGRKIPYESWAKEQARLDVPAMFRDKMKAQTVVRSAHQGHSRWTHGFGGAGNN